MREKRKRVLSAIMAVITILTSVLSSANLVFAASEQARIKFWIASTNDVGYVTELKGNYYQDKLLYSVIDGHSAYCMNYGLSADGGQLMTSDTTAQTPMTQEQNKLMAYCMFFGYSADDESAPNDDMKNAHIATQAMVWIIEGNKYGTAEGDSAAQKFCNSAPDPAATYNYYSTLKANINNSYYARIPSFSTKYVFDAPTYELKWNVLKNRYQTTLTDSNGVLDTYNIEAAGYGVEKSGNSVIIYSATSKTNETSCKVVSSNGRVDTTSSCVFWITGKSGYQEFVSTRPTADPIQSFFKVKTENLGYAAVTKTDESSGKKIKGVKFGVYSDSGCTKLVQEITTNSDGYAKSKELIPGTYYMKETYSPASYSINSKVYTVSVEAGKTNGISVSNKEQLAKLTIYKEGEVLLAWNGKQFTYKTEKIKGCTFKVTAGADIIAADGRKIYNKGDVVANNLITGTDGKVVLNNLHIGTYIVTETKSVNGFALNTKPYTVNISHRDQSATVISESKTITNTRQKANVNVIKKDNVTKNVLAGGQYTIYAGADIKNNAGTVIVKKDTALQTVTTGADGKAVYSLDLPINNSCYVKETKAPDKYIRSTEKYSFKFEYMDESKKTTNFTHTFMNARTTASISVIKVDKETGKTVPQGDASLEGAVYGLYANEDIKHPDGKTGTIYTKDTLVKKLTIDKDGKASVSSLYLGKYYLLEIKAPVGYVKDTEKHEINCSYEGDYVSDVKKTCKLTEQVMKQPFQLIKIGDNGSDTESDLLAGVEFKAYLESSLTKDKDGRYDFEKCTPVVIGENGSKIITTDNKGFAQSIAIPYGKYIVVESKTPHNMAAIDPFEVNIAKNSPDKAQTWRVFIDRTFSAKLRIIKKDAETKQTVLVPNATFKIYDVDNKKYIEQITTYPSKVVHKTFSTDEDGDLILPEELKCGNYRIEEVAGPENYTINTKPVNVSIDTNTFYEVDSDTNEAIITVEYEDVSVKGQITVEKRGDQLTGVETKGGQFVEDGKFIYKEGSLAGATFEIYAAEDIYTADNQKDENGNRIKIYSNGDKVTTLVTSKNGKATTKELPLGKYKVVETIAPYGYVINKEEQTAVLKYVDDKTAVVTDSHVFKDERQKIQMTVIKIDSETNKTVKGAEFGLYAAEDIKDKDGKVIIKANELLEKVVSDENGIIAFEKDYPFAKYYAKEIKVPDGYVSSSKKYSFKTSYQGQDIPIAKYTCKAFNTPTTVEFTKTDITSGAELSGATLSVIDDKENVIETWTSNAKESHIIKRLTVGKTYTLREEFAPYGYLKAEDVKFTVRDTEDIQKVEMKDEVPTGTIVINKNGELLMDVVKGYNDWFDHVFRFDRFNLKGVTFNLYAAEDIVSPDGLNTVYYHKDQFIKELVTDEMGFAAATELPLGKYYLVEIKTLPGFIMDNSKILADVSYVEQNVKVVFAGNSITNERQKVKITVVKKDSETDESLQGAIFGLYSKYDINDNNGKVAVKADEKIEMAVSDENGQISFISDLPLGMYYAKEIQAPKGYVTTDQILDIDVTSKNDTDNVVECTGEVVNTPITVEISKTDITGAYELKGAELEIIDSNGNVYESWKSTGEKHVIKRIPTGKYILRETFAPYGFLRAEDVSFEVKDLEEIQKVVMKDAVPTGTITIKKDGEVLDKVIKDKKLDYSFSYEKKGLSGITFNVYAEEDIVNPANLDEVYFEKEQLVAEIVTDDDGIATIENLPLGKYYVVETKTLPGFILDSTPISVDVSYVEQDAEVVYSETKLTNERQKVNVSVEKKDSETKKPLQGAMFGLFAKDDIVNFDGKVVVKANERIALAVSDKNGQASFDADIPIGMYYLKEVQAPTGYVTSNKIVDVDMTSKNDTDKVIEYTAKYENTPIKVEFSKTDITGEHELIGAKLSIIDSNGNVVENWTSNGKKHMIERLPVGKYVLREETAPYGYKIANYVKFEVMKKSGIQKVSMKDELVKGRIVINKTDKVTGSPIAGVEFEIRNKDGKMIGTLVTDKKGHAESELLDIAIFKDGSYKEDIKYDVVETKAAKGYSIDNTKHEVVFKYDGKAPDEVIYTLGVTNIPEVPDHPKTGDNFNPWVYAGLGLSSFMTLIICIGKRRRKELI